MQSQFHPSPFPLIYGTAYFPNAMKAETRNPLQTQSIYQTVLDLSGTLKNVSFNSLIYGYEPHYFKGLGGYGMSTEETQGLLCITVLELIVNLVKF